MSSQDHAREKQTYSYRPVDAIFLGPGTLTILTLSSKFYLSVTDGDIYAALQMHSIEIKYLGFSRLRKGRDVNE